MTIELATPISVAGRQDDLRKQEKRIANAWIVARSCQRGFGCSEGFRRDYVDARGRTGGSMVTRAAPVSDSTTWLQLFDFGSGPRRVCPKVASPILAEFVAVFELAMLHPTCVSGKTHLLSPDITCYSRNARNASKKLSFLGLAETLVDKLLFTRAQTGLHCGRGRPRAKLGI